jgi:hypothetical protein
VGETHPQPEAGLLVSYLKSLQEHNDTGWFWPSPSQPVDVTMPSELSAWCHHVLAYLQEHAGMASQQSRGWEFKGPDLKAIGLISPTSGVLSTKLSWIYYRSELYAFISGEGDFQEHESDIEIWAQALNFATQKLSEGHPEHSWWAVIGPTPQMNGITKTIGGPLTINGIHLREGALSYEDDRQKSLQGLHIHAWIPVIVEGRSTGYNWNAASQKANKDIYRLCALLSLETEQHWTRREPANATESTPIVLPEPNLFIRSANPVIERELRQRIAQLDEAHLTTAWDNLHRNPAWERPLYAYYQGMGLVLNFPSYAVVAFVAAIEQTGKLLFAPETPAKCPECNHPMFNPASRLFRQALELVVEKDKAKQIADDLYRWRSGTAHSGVLLGNETTFGDWGAPEVLVPSRPSDKFFAFGLLDSMRTARNLLRKLLAGELTSHKSAGGECDV